MLPRILIVDDEREITEILADLLSEDYECLKAGSAEQALDCLRAGVAKLVYAPDSKSGELHCSCRFESDLRHH